MESGDADASSRSLFGSSRGSSGKGAKQPRPRFLNGKQIETLEALVARVIPSDETAGAREAGVVWYIDARLAQAHPHERLEYRAGLSNLDKLALVMCRKRFADAEADVQDRLLGEVERGDVSGWPESQAFFARVRQHAAEGFLCDPKYGGNRDCVGWKHVASGGEPQPEGYTEEDIHDARQVLPFYGRRAGETNDRHSGR